MSKKLKVGAIGCGYWGPNLIRNFIEIPEVDLCAIADLDQSRLDHLQTRYPQIKMVTRDYSHLFNLGLDAVVVATPPATHFAIVRECLLRGLHVLVEKPLTMASNDALKLIEIAKQQDRILMVGHTFEYNPAVRALKKIIDSGEIGQVQYIDAVRVSLGLFHPTMNVIWDLAPHDISILHHLLGTTPLTVTARGTSCVQPNVEDIAYLTLTFPNNILAHMRLSWLDPRKTRCITVVGSKKMVIYDDVASLEKIKIYDKGVKTIRHTDTFGEFQFSYHYGDIVTPYIHFEEPLRLECLHFLESIRANKSPLTDGNSGLKVVKVIEAAQKSLQDEGGLVTINPHWQNGKNGQTTSDLASMKISESVALDEVTH